MRARLRFRAQYHTIVKDAARETASDVGPILSLPQRLLQARKQSIHLGRGLGVEVPTVGDASPRRGEEAALDEQVLFDGEEAVESRLQLQRDDRANGIV